MSTMIALLADGGGGFPWVLGLLGRFHPAVVHFPIALLSVATLFELQQRRALRQRLYTGEVPDGIALTVAIAERFRDAVERTGAHPVVLLIPMRELLDLHAAPDGFPLVPALRARGLDVVDLGPPIAAAVREDGPECCFLDDGHLSPQGNARVAAWLAAYLPARRASRAEAGACWT